MKKLMTIAMVAFSVAVFAQTGKQISKSENTEFSKSKKADKIQKGKKEKGAKGDFSKKFESLDLTDSQKAELKALKGDKKAKGDLAQKQKLTKEEKQAMRAEMDKKIKTILTPEQYAKFSAKQESKGNNKKI